MLPLPAYEALPPALAWDAADVWLLLKAVASRLDPTSESAGTGGVNNGTVLPWQLPHRGTIWQSIDT